MTSASTNRSHDFLSFNLRIFILFLVIYFVIGLIPLYFLFSLAIESLNQETGKRLLTAAAVGATVIDGDAHARIRSTEDLQSENYALIKKQMRQILHALSDARIVHVYSLRLNTGSNDRKEGTFFVCDSAEPGDFPFLQKEDIASFHAPYCLGPAMEEAFKGQPSATSFIYGNRCGSWRTGYAPIRTSDGAIDAILCVDGSADDTLKNMNRLHSWSVFSIVFSLFFLFLLMTVIAYSRRKEMNPE